MLDSSEQNLVKVAVAGRTNTGKTTTIRTLTKKKIGSIADRPNETKEALKIPYSYEGMQAAFIDTPGFQEANLLMLVKDGTIPLTPDIAERLRYDIRAFNAIERSDIVLYLASLETVPNDSYHDEIRLVVLAQKKVIALLNKGIGRADFGGRKIVKDRIDQWKSYLYGNGVSQVFEFDSHWYVPETVLAIYKTIEELIPEDRKPIFREGLNEFKTRQEKTSEQACMLLSECIFRCREKVEVQASAFDYDASRARHEVAIRISSTVTEEVNKFLQGLSRLYYRITVPLDESDVIDFKPDTLIQTNIRDIVTSASATAGGSAAFGAAIGASIGAISAGAVTGGAATLGGLWLGSQVGTIIGSFVGGAWGAVDGVNNRISGQLTHEDLQQLELSCITAIWAISQHGFGIGPGISSNIMNRRLEIATERSASHQHDFDWATVDRNSALSWCKKRLDDLQDVSLESIASSR